jgi:hypothetical protein
MTIIYPVASGGRVDKRRVGRAAVHAAAAKLYLMGLDVEHIDPISNRITVREASAAFTVQVHGRTDQTCWQISLSNAVERADGDRAWIFVGFDADGTDRFYVVPGWWLKDEVATQFREEIPTGVRVKNPDSDHWSIYNPVVREYRDRWDLVTG